MNKTLTAVLGLLLCAGVARADLTHLDYLDPVLETQPESPILVRGETLNSFRSRIRSELTCTNLNTRLHDYEITRRELDTAVTNSFRTVSEVLRKWDNELYQLAGRKGWRYTGALGDFARRVDQYNDDLYGNQLKLQSFITIYGERLDECLRQFGQQ